MKWTTACATVAALTGAIASLAQTAHPAQHSVTAVRHWTASGATRIAIEVSGEFEYRSDRLHDPERVYYDILNSRPKFDKKRLFTEDLSDPFVRRIRVAETTPGITRVVFDLTGPVEVRASVLTSPDRLMVELRTAPAGTQSGTVSVNTSPQFPPTHSPDPITPSVVKSASPLPIVPPSAPAPPKTSAGERGPKTELVAAESHISEPIMPEMPAVRTASVQPAALPVAASPAAALPATSSPGAGSPPTVSATAAAPVTVSPAMESPAVPSTDAMPPAATPSGLVPKAARRTSTGETSLVRALGLKLQRIVIDPGHGGHDEGTQGPKGLLEKDLVLDVSLRLGKLIEQRMGAQVIYTRTDDTFIPLEGRTALANEKKADLFLSIHANSSPIPRITGVETYYLNFTGEKDAMEVASRENASSDKSIFELHDLIAKISQHDKASESRDFAERIQAALFAFSSKTFTAERNRGVKKAPFVVLIGANMPSVLAEIGFVSNPREESLLTKPDYRQKLAEALYRGVSKYADSLSHFQVAAN